MPLVFAAITPHSPLLISTIGKEHRSQFTATLAALDLLAERLANVRADSICILTPHGNDTAFITPLTGPEPVEANLKEFGDLTYVRAYPLSTALIASPFPQSIANAVRLTDVQTLDYGVTIPLLFLIRDTKKKISIAPIRTSDQSLKIHYDFGTALGERFHERSERIAIIASAELSHVHHESDLANTAEAFDRAIQDALINHDPEPLLHISPSERHTQKSCGLAPLTVLTGLLGTMQAQCDLLSYEHPMGVGLITAELKIHYI